MTRGGAGSGGDQDPRIDRFALGRVQLAALLGFLASVVSVGVEIAGQASFGLVTTGTSSATPVELSGWFLALVGISFVVGIITILLFRSAFVALRGSAEAFSSPVSLVTVGLVGLALLVPALVVLLIGLTQELSCLNSNPPVMPLCPIGAWVLVGAVVLLVAAVLALIGAIGLILGIWRLGTRYDNSLFSVGAILLIIPYVSVVGYLLILIAARGELGRFSRPGAIPPTF